MAPSTQTFGVISNEEVVMTKVTGRWVGGLTAMALGSMLALAGCASTMEKGSMDKETMDKK